MEAETSGFVDICLCGHSRRWHRGAAGRGGCEAPACACTQLAVTPVHPGADFDVTDERPPIEKAPTVDDLALVMAGLFVVRDGNVAEADTIDIPIVGEVDEGGVVRWAGGGR